MVDGIIHSGMKKVVLGAIIAFVGWSAVSAQQTPPLQGAKAPEVRETAYATPDRNQLKTLRTKVETSADLNASDKKKAQSLLDQAIRLFDETQRIDAETQTSIKKLRDAPARIKAIETELSRKKPAPEKIADSADTARLNTAELEQRVREEKSNLAAVRESLNNLQDQIEGLKARPVQLQEESAEAMRRLQEVRNTLREDSTDSDEPRLLAEARSAALLAEHAMLKAKIHLFEQQLLNQDIFVSLLTAERDLAGIELSRSEARTQAWQTAAQQRRKQQAIQAQTDAEAAKNLDPDLPPVVKEQYNANIELGKNLEQLTNDESRSIQELNRLQSELISLEEEFAQIRQRIQGVILSETIGLTLRQRRRELPGPENYRRNSAQRQQIISQVGEAQFVIDEKQRALVDLKAEIEKIFQSLPSTDKDNIAKWEDRIRELLMDRRDLLGKLQKTYRRYYRNLQTLEFTEQRLSSLINEYAGFLDGQLLWIRSSKIIGLSDLRHLPAAFYWLVKPHNWWLLSKDLIGSFGSRPITWILGLLIAGGLFVGRGRANRNLEQISRNVGRVRRDAFMLTVRALGLTLYLAASWPFLLALTSWQLSTLQYASDFSRAAGSGFSTAAYIWAIVNFLDYLCREYGVGQVHFRWRDTSRLTLHRQLLWLKPLWVSLIFVIVTIDAANKIYYGYSLGRLAFMAVIIALGVFAVRMFKITAGKTTNSEGDAKQGLLRRLIFFWYAISIALPALLVLLSVSGYYYTAIRLTWQFHDTALLVVALILGNHLTLRWLVIAQRRLAYEETVRKRKEQLEAEREQEGESPQPVDGSEIESFEIEEPEISQAQITLQTRDLLRTLLFFSGLIGLWIIWNDVLPAMQMLEDIHLWKYSVEVEGVTKNVPITLTNVLFAILVAIVTFVAARNLPGVLEITLLKYLPVDAGARYAMSTIFQYVVAAIGIIITFNCIGINWGSMKWLVAALGVGIGFGLQEIIANFVSGLIILFERPVRIGDIVTVGNIDGVVSRIRIRATTITSWDRKEYLVPNKEFITGRVLNWTLTNAINRIIINVGIAYGSDTELARELLLKAAQEHPNVLEDPPPIATFEGFGDNSLNFLLRAFLPNLDNRLVTITELHTAIDNVFREAGITIAFPQRDVHLDITHPLDVRGMYDQRHADDAGPKTES